MTPPWLDSSPPPDVRRLTDRQLVETLYDGYSAVEDHLSVLMKDIDAHLARQP